MKRLARFFSLALLVIATLTLTVMPVAAAESSIDIAKLISDNLVYVIIAAVAVVLLVILIIVKATNSKKTSDMPSPVAAADEPVDEQPVEEAPAQAVEESPVAEPVEETPAPAAESVEAKTEEAPVEEAPAEVVEEGAKPEFAELSNDYIAPEKDIPAEAVDPETGCTYTFNEKGIPVPPEGKVIRYKWSFLARISQAHSEVKYHYMTLRRTLLAYNKMRSNVSWNFDSYFVGRKTIAKLKIRGKNLVAYFPIDPKEMEGTKYIGEDASKVSRYKAVPFAYRINGMRKLKYALELIEKQLEGVKSTDPVYITEAQVNEAIPRESLKKLFGKGYVRVGGILAVGDRASAEDEDDEDVVDVTDDAADDEAAPSPLKEEFNFNPKAQ